jgi:hypothetical protein
MVYIIFALNIFFNVLALIILGVFVEGLLIMSGLVRGDTLGVVVGCFLIGFIMSLVDFGRDYLLFWLGLVFLVPVSMNRIDIYSSLTKGRWWWKSDDKHKQQET